MDFIVELPESAGHDLIMVVVDSVTKRAHFASTLTTITAAGTARLFLQLGIITGRANPWVNLRVYLGLGYGLGFCTPT